MHCQHSPAKVVNMPPLCRLPRSGMPALPARGSPESLKWTCRHCSEVMLSLKSGEAGSHFTLFRSHARYHDPMTFIYDLDPYPLKIYLHKLSKSRLAKVRTNAQIDRFDSKHIQRRFAGGKNKFLSYGSADLHTAINLSSQDLCSVRRGPTRHPLSERYTLRLKKCGVEFLQ